MIVYANSIRESVDGGEVEIAVIDCVQIDCAKNEIQLSGMTRPQLIDLLTRVINQLQH